VIIAAIVLMISSRFLPGLKIAGFIGALVASLAIGSVYWLVGLLLGMLIT
jgi:putative membrane protein